MSTREDAERRYAQIEGERDYYKRLAEKREAERDHLARRLERITSDIRILIDESAGVYGLHMNGDPAPWGDLLAGGRFEEWLRSLDGEPPK